MRRNWVLIALTASLLTLVSLLTLHLHYKGNREVLSQFQERQLSYAKHLSNQIQFFIQARSRGLKALSSFRSLQSGDANQRRLDIQAYAREMGKIYVKTISLYDELGTVVYSTGPDTIGSKRSKGPFYPWLERRENRGKILLIPAFPGAQSLALILVTPLYQDVSDTTLPKPKGKFTGALACTLDMKEFLANQLASADPKINVDQVWIMDKDGTLLFQPDHPEMVLQNIYQREGNCRQCHPSFDYIEEILTKRLGTADYRIRNHPKKIAAFAPMEFENVSWVVVVNTSYDRVTGFVKKSLGEHLILLGIVVLAFAIGSSIIIHKERLRINAVQQSEGRYRMLVETMNDGLGVQNEKGLWTYVNDRLCEMLGYSRDEMIGRPVTNFLSEGGQKIYEEQMAGRTKGERKFYELSWLKKDGRTIFTLVSPKPIFDEHGQFKGSFAVITGITELKQAEEALKESEKQLRDLSAQLLTAQETERKRISRELHDELGQALTVMKLRLNFIGKDLSEHQTNLKQECQDGIQHIDQIIENVRRLSRDLSPTILEDFGLTAALRRLINNFAKTYNIKVILDMTDIDSLIPADSHLTVYRTIQEALTNIGKHSRAKNVSIAIHEDDDSVLFSVEDDGIGFDERMTVKRSPEEKGLGLATMKGRTQMVGGIFRIFTKEGKGTRITLNIPIKRGVLL